MMRNTALKFSMTMLLTCCIICIKSENSMAQVDINSLTEVTKSCKDDTKNTEYYKQMNIESKYIPLIGGYGSIDMLMERCIYYRYHHLLVQSKLPWLNSTGEIIPGYPGSVAISLITEHANYQRTSAPFIDCIINQNPDSLECESTGIFTGIKISEIPSISYSSSELVNLFVNYFYVCPSCVVAHDNVVSYNKMMVSFIKWFHSLDKTKRKGILSIIENNNMSSNIRSEIQRESQKSVERYIELREKIRQEEKERKRRDFLGN